MSRHTHADADIRQDLESWLWTLAEALALGHEQNTAYALDAVREHARVFFGISAE